MNINDILNNKWAIPVVVGVTSFAVGSASGYILGKKKVNQTITYYLSDIRKESAKMEEVIVSDEVEEPDFDGEEIEFIEEGEPGNPHTFVQNIFSAPRSLADWDEEYEVANRVDGEPYVIQVEEFIENANEYHQQTVTYYMGDDIMADESDTPIYGHAELMGELKWGHGTNDPNVVYIRNDERKQEWEVLRHTGHYGVEILGLEIENEYETQDIKHSSNYKFRDD